MSNILSKTWVRGLVIGLVSFASMALASQSRFLKLIELKSLDFKFFLRGFLPGDSRIFLVGIDDLSIHTLGRWPWPRSYHAALLERLSERPPMALGFDVLFNLPDESHPESDEALAQVSRLFDHLTFASYFREADPGKVEFQLPIQKLSQGSDFGFINAPRDLDGSVRRMPLVTQFEGSVYPSFALRMIMNYYNLSQGDVELLKGNGLRLHFPPEADLPMAEKDQILDIPMDGRGNFLVNFRSRLEDMRSGSFAQVLKRERILSNQMVVVGLTATGISDSGPTPLSPHTPLVMVHLNLLQNILQGDFLRVLHSGFDQVILLVVSVLTSMVSYGARKVWAALGSMFVLFIFGFLNFTLFSCCNVQFSFVHPVLGIFLSYLVSTTGRYWIEERKKRYVKQAFQHYVSPAVLEKVLKDPKGLELGGKSEDLTVLFLDICKFASYCEKKSPETVVSILNEFFDGMTQIILSHGGTLDKYLGDGLMAIFGAPVPLDEDHARLAVRAAVEMQKRLKGLRQKWVHEGKDPLFMGIGINTGPMVVGNMGSSHVMNYTAVGDEVNLAARLEGLTRQFGVEVLISQSTYDRVCSEWEGRSLGETKIKGREGAVAVYEVVGRRGE